MRAGALDRRITLKSRSESQTSLGGPTESFSEIATVWARWKPAPGSQSFGASQRVDTAAGFFEIRHRADVDALAEVEFDSKRYEVIGEPEEIGRRVGLRINVRRRVE